MKILAFDSSTTFLSLALQEDEAIYTYHREVGQAASERILPEIQTLLDQANRSLTALDAIVFGAGPGSFTGVRIACGVAQGLALGADLPVVGVNVLTALAQASGAERVIAATDARMGEVYHASYIKEGHEWQAVHTAGVYKPDQLPVIDGEGWVGVGSAWKVHQAALSEQYGGNVVNTIPDALPMAEAMIAIAIPQIQSGKAQVASEARPVYIRNRVALTTEEREQGMRL